MTHFDLGKLELQKDFPGGAVVENPPLMQEEQETWVQTHSSILTWEIP